MTDKGPRCENRKRNAKGSRYQCHNQGVHCWVQGEFSRVAKVLCNTCITALRAQGWKVKYQLEGETRHADSKEGCLPGQSAE